MSDSRGMFYILHGDQEFLRAEEVSRLKGQIAQDGLGDLNITTLDGRTATIEEILRACNTAPFLTNRRLIIVENLLQRFEARQRITDMPDEEGTPSEEPPDVAKLTTYLPHLPPFARLLFVEDRTLKASNPLLKSAKKLANGYVREFKAPAADELPGWIAGRARQKGVDISRRAASLLASFIGDDLRALDLELEKLAAYVNYARPIEIEDVQALVSATQEANIFNLVDALGLRQHRSALSHLRALMAGGANELYVLAMVARQIRLIIAVKELAQARGLRGAELRRALKISHQFIVDKLLRQAEQFQMEELEALMNQLVEVDEAIKTGRIDGGLALEMLTLSICRRPAGEASHQPSNALRSR